MKCLLETCLIAIALTANIIPSAGAQSSADQPMQKGISVELVTTKSAVPVPEADKGNAWIVTLTSNGSVFFGTHEVTFDSLAKEMIRLPRKREQQLYIKADARTPYANVEKALDAASRAGFETPVLLTAQPESPAPGMIEPPVGLDVLVGPPLPGSVTVQIQSSDQGQPLLKVNGEPTTWANLPGALRQSLQNQGKREVVVRADEEVAFARVVNAIDTCRSERAKIIMAAPSL